MSMTCWARAHTPVLKAEQFPNVLAGLILAQPSDRNVLTILGLAAVDRPVAGRGADRPRATLRRGDVVSVSLTTKPLRRLCKRRNLNSGQ